MKQTFGRMYLLTSIIFGTLGIVGFGGGETTTPATATGRADR